LWISRVLKLLKMLFHSLSHPFAIVLREILLPS
jgi:hypothetical protein